MQIHHKTMSKKLLSLTLASFSFALLLTGCGQATKTMEGPYTIDDIKIVAENEFPKWAEMWGIMIPDFDVAQMTASDEEDIVYYFELEYKNGLPDFFMKYVPFSPDKTKYVLITDPGFFEEEEGRLIFMGGEPDVYVNLVDKKTNTIKQILQCGTPCSLNKAAWLDNNTFIVAGSSENSSADKIPAIWFFDLEKGKKKYLSGANGVPYEEYAENRYDILELMK